MLTRILLSTFFLGSVFLTQANATTWETVGEVKINSGKCIVVFNLNEGNKKFMVGTDKAIRYQITYTVSKSGFMISFNAKDETNQEYLNQINKSGMLTDTNVTCGNDKIHSAKIIVFSE